MTDTPITWPPEDVDPQDVSDLGDIMAYLLEDTLGEVPRDRLEALAVEFIQNGTDGAQERLHRYLDDL